MPDGAEATLSGPALAGALASNLTGFAFGVTQKQVPNIWVARLVDGKPSGALVQRTFEREGGTYPLWSPDGRWIAYQCQDAVNVQLCVTGAFEGPRVQLTTVPGQSWTGGWAPDNDRILIAAQRDAVWNVMWVSRQTGAVQAVTGYAQPRVYVRYPRWDRANHRVLFEYSETIGRIWSVEVPR